MKDKSASAEPQNRRFSVFPKSLAQTLTPVLKPVYKKHGFAEHRILTEWHLIVGSEMASYCLPQKLSLPRAHKEGGTLHILVSAARALELQHMQPVILSKIATYFGYPAVSKLAFVQASGVLFKRKAKPMVKPKAAPDAALTALVANCEDEEMRAALLSLGVAIAAVEN